MTPADVLPHVLGQHLVDQHLIAHAYLQMPDPVIAFVPNHKQAIRG
jgi:hypothetical protein